jgi:hypothetical protein
LRARASAPALACALAAVALAAVVLASAGCRTGNAELPAVCKKGARRLAAALQAAPKAVRLEDGTRLSRCVHDARADADLQTVGTVYTQVADALASRLPTSESAAVELGYLTGAVRRGASGTNGTATELVRRVEQAPGLAGPPADRRASYERGIAAGRRSG